MKAANAALYLTIGPFLLYTLFMRLNRFFVKFNRSGENIVVNDNNFFEQVNKVLKLKIGDELIICDGPGNDLLCRIESFGKDRVEMIFIKSMDNNKEPKRKVILYCSVLKHDNFEIVAQKATEVGVYRIVPVISSRTVKTNIRIDRIQKIIKEAAELSGRSIIPEILDPLNLDEALVSSRENDQNFILNMDGGSLSREDLGDRIGIFIGPEGGWADDEIDNMLNMGFNSISLSELTFRAETAAIIATYLILK